MFGAGRRGRRPLQNALALWERVGVRGQFNEYSAIVIIIVGDGVLAQHAEVTRCERPVIVTIIVGDGVLDVPLG